MLGSSGSTAGAGKSGSPKMPLTVVMCSAEPPLGSRSQKQPPEAAPSDRLAAEPDQVWADDHHFDGMARAGVLMLTCMDSRIEPLGMIGLEIGDAKILRTPGAHLTPDALIGCILGVHALNVNRIMVVTHTRCAMASDTDHIIG